MKTQAIIFTGLVSALLNNMALADITQPQMKPGLWETKSNMMGTAISTRHCIDKAKVAESKNTADDFVKKNCSNVKQSQSGNIYSTEMTCNIGGKPTLQKTVVTLISADEMKSHTSWVTNGKPNVVQSHVKRISDCKAEKASSTEGMMGKDGKLKSYDDMVKEIQANMKKHKN